MTSILNQIVAAKKNEVLQHKRTTSLEVLQAFCEDSINQIDFIHALDTKTPAIIAECKKKSPSAGVLIEDYDPVVLAGSYQQAGACAVSVLTDEPFFGGDLSHLEDVAAQVSIPVLRKDFIIDEYQIYEARRYGAASYLLLASLLDAAMLQYFIEVGRDLGMEPLVEVHNREELVSALKTDAKIIGINNRNLKNMTVDKSQATALLKEFAGDLTGRILVYESGVTSHQDIENAQLSGFDAFLVGSALVTSPNPQKALVDLLGVK